MADFNIGEIERSELNKTTSSNSQFASLRELEKQLGKRKALNKDFQFYLTELSKKSDLERLKEEIKNCKNNLEKRQKLENEYAQKIKNIQEKAYRAATETYKNLVDKSMSEYAIKASKTYADAEKTHREEIEETFARETSGMDKRTKQYKQLNKQRQKDLRDSVKVESQARKIANEKELAYEKSYANALGKRSEKLKAIAKARQNDLDNAVQKYVDLKEAGASEAQLKKAKQDISTAKEESFKADQMVNLFDKLGQTINNLGQGVSNVFHEVENLMTEYNAPISSRLQGSGKTFSNILDLTVTNTSVSPWVKTTEVLSAVKRASDQGIAYNIEQRAFLESISDKIASTFDAFDSNLTRLIRLQQADSTAARLGMEASLTSTFNKLFEDTSYLSELYDSVSGAIIDASSQLNRSDSAQFEYVVQKWLGSLSSVGMSSTAIQGIAQGLNYLGTGDVQALASNNSLQTLLAMSASRANLSYSDLLLGGLNASNTNKLLEAMVGYLKEISEQSPNLVVRGAYGDIFNLSASDFTAVQNLSSSDISTISANTLSYDGMLSELQNQFSALNERIPLSEKLSNITANAKFGLGTEIYNSPALYAMMKALDTLDALGIEMNIPAVWGFDLNTTVNNIMKSGIGLTGSIGLISSVLGSLGADGGLDLAAWGGNDVVTRGSLSGNGLSTTLGGTSSSTYVATGSTRDIKKSSITSATEEAQETEKIIGETRKEKTFADFYNAVVEDDSHVVVKEAYLSQAYDEGKQWIRAFDETVSTQIQTVFGTTSFYDKRLNVSDNSLDRYSTGTAIRVTDSGLNDVVATLLAIQQATQAQASAKSQVQTVRIDENSLKTAFVKALSENNGEGNVSLQEVLNLLKSGEIVFKAKNDFGNTFDVNVASISPSASVNIRR